MVVQFLLAFTLRQLTGPGVLSACFLLNGCTTFTDSSLNTATNGQSVFSYRSSKPKFKDPFRGSSTANYNSFGSIAPTASFQWNTVALTASGEPMQASSTGDGGFRSLVIGSVGGNDPVAVKLTETLARYLHHNQLITGGINPTVVRTLNPEGMKQGRYENSNDVYLNTMFPRSGLDLSPAEASQLPREVQFLIHFVSAQRPQRIIHIRTVRGSRGMLALSHGATDSGREIAEWLDLKIHKLPEDVSEGTLESWASHRGDCDVITIGIPRRTEANDVWALYGDAVLSLLLDGDSETRRITREQKQQRSANRQGQWNESNDEMFQESGLNKHNASAGTDAPVLE